MNETLIAALAILRIGLIDIDNPIVKTLEARPEAWIRANLKTAMYPAVFLWADGEDLGPGRKTRCKDRTVRMVAMSMTSSVDANAALTSNRSAHAIGARVQELLEANKRLIVDSVSHADGLMVPIKSQSYQYTDKGSFYAIGWATMYTFKKYDIPWVSEANPSAGY